MSTSSTPSPDLYAQTLILGGLVGARTGLPVALLSQSLRRRRAPAPELNIPTTAEPAMGTLATWLGNAWVARVLTLMALGEIMADKLPATPNRTEPAGLIGRVLFGAVAGAGLWQARGESGALGGLLGGGSALLNTYATFGVRTVLTKVLPPVAAGLAEDALVAVAAAALLPTARRRLLKLQLW